LVVLLLLVGGGRAAGGTVLSFFPRDDQQRATIRVIGVNLRLGPRVEVRCGRLEQCLASGRY
jgi:hypothetical protein